MTSRSFSLGDVLSVTTGYLVSPRGVDAMYDLLNFMTGDNLFTHQLPRAAEECGPALLAQYPALADVTVPEKFDGEAHVWSWLAEQVERFGDEFEVTPLAEGDHTRIHPLDELRMMAPDKPVIVIETPDGAP